MIAGLTVTSELAIPAATPSSYESTAQTDVMIRWGEPPCAIPDAKYRDSWVEIGDQEFIFRPKDGLAFVVRGGREITISRTLEISDSDIYLFLVGSAWGVLCHQRSLLPLHCSAIEFGGRAIAFTGPSGAGKSTLAAGLSKRGYPHLCDDVCIVDLSGGGVRLLPMPKGLKLWGDATVALNMTCEAAISADQRWDKYYVSVPEYEGEERLEISALYVLRSDDTKEPSISLLRGSDRFQAILSNVYRYEWLSLMRDPADVFNQISELVKRLRVFRFSRPWDMSSFDLALNVLEAHIRQLAIEEQNTQSSDEMGSFRAAS
jgi:hypothetical protein